ncbi:secreted protein [Beggiatoa sp. PS]|nr:secreted protein [Beggiatoa sp. PS]
MTYYRKHWPLLLLALMLGPFNTHAINYNAMQELTAISTIRSSSDTLPPVLYSVEVIPHVIQDNGIITVSVNATDDLSGIKFIWLHEILKPDGTNFLNNNVLNNFEFDEKTQRYVQIYELPKYVPIGEWKVGLIELQDNVGNYKNYHGNDGYNTTFQVLSSSQVDISPPTLHSIEIIPSIIQGEDSITISIEATDDLSGIEFVWLYEILKPDGTNFLTNHVINNFEFEPKTQRYLQSYNFPKHIPSGVWKLGNILLQDHIGNEKVYHGSDEYNATFQVESTQVEPGKLPIAVFNIFPKKGKFPLIVTLDATDSAVQDGTIVDYVWTISDGQQVSGNNQQITFNNAGTYTITLTVTDNEGLTASTQDTITISESGPVIVEPGQAIIIAGTLSDDTLFSYSNEFAQRMYRLLVKRGYNDENIHYINVMAPDVEPFDGHLEPERQDYKLFNPEQELTEAFAQATANLKAGEQFILYFHGHARPDLVYLADYELSATQLRELLATVPTGVQQIIILDTCYAGSFLDDLAGVADRIVIASTNADTLTFQVIGNSFANEFLSLLEYGESLMGAFRGAEDVILNNPKLFAGQRPWLDDDSDGQFLNDGLRSADVYIETQRLQQSPPPKVKQVHPYITLPDNVGSATLWAQTTPSPEFIHQVRAVLVKPNYQPIEYRGKDTDFSRLELPLVYNPAQERYEIVYDGFCAEPGTWQIQYQAQDTDGAWSEIVTGEVQAQNCTTLATTQMSLNQSRYTTGEAVRLDMTVNGNALVDLYVAIVFPDGVFMTIAHPLNFSWPNAVHVYQSAVQITEKQTYSIMDFPLPGGIALGNYSACGVLVPAGHENPIDATQWIHSHCIGFEVY